MLVIGGTYIEWGRCLFVVFKINCETARVFGSPRKLACVLASTGMPLKETTIGEGLEFHAPYRVATGRTRAGRYLAIEKVFPASAT